MTFMQVKMYLTYLIVHFVAYSVYLPPMGRRRRVKKYCLPPRRMEPGVPGSPGTPDPQASSVAYTAACIHASVLSDL